MIGTSCGWRRRSGDSGGQAGLGAEELAVIYKCIYSCVTVRIGWDEKKNRANLKKHGLSFEDADIVLAGPTVTFEDNRADYGEERLISLGALAGRVVVVVHTPRGNATRGISMRKANARERKIYQERLEETRRDE